MLWDEQEWKHYLAPCPRRKRLILPGAENYRFMGIYLCLNWFHFESPPSQINARFHKRDLYNNSQNDVMYSVFSCVLISQLPTSATAVCNLAALKKSTNRNTVEYGFMYKSLLDTCTPSLASIPNIKPYSESIKLGNKQSAVNVKKINAINCKKLKSNAN